MYEKQENSSDFSIIESINEKELKNQKPKFQIVQQQQQYNENLGFESKHFVYKMLWTNLEFFSYFLIFFSFKDYDIDRIIIYMQAENAHQIQYDPTTDKDRCKKKYCKFWFV